MNSTFVMISILMKSKLCEKCLINALMNISSEALENYLDMANIYSGKSTKKKAQLVEMIIHGCIANTIHRGDIKDISTIELNKELSERRILVKPLPAYGNKGLKKKDLVKREWFYLIISLLILHVWIVLIVLLVLCIYFLLV